MRDRDIERFGEQARVLKGSRKGERLSEASRRKYKSNLRNYLQWLESEGFEDWFDVRPSDIGAFMTDRENKGRSGSDIAAHIRSLKRFYDWLGQDYPNEENPVVRHLESASYSTNSSLRKKNGYKKGITDGEYQLMLDNVPDTHKARDRLILRFLGEMGLRRKEVSHLEIGDVDIENRRVDVPDVKSSARSIPFPRDMRSELRRWLHGGERKQYKDAYTSNRLFVSQQAGTLSGQAINKIVKRAAEKVGIQETYTDANGHKQHRVRAHQLRHYFGQTEFDRDEMSLKALSEYMGHSSVDVTADIYGDMDKDQVFDMLEKQFE